MTGGLFDAATLERWNVINRVLPDAELRDKTLEFAHRLAAGPTRANAATKQMVRAFLEHGVRGADDRVGEIAAPLFATEDLQNAVRTFLEQGPGKATFRVAGGGGARGAGRRSLSRGGGGGGPAADPRSPRVVRLARYPDQIRK